MRHFRSAALIGLAALAGAILACFHPDLDNGVIVTCTGEGSACPEGRTCVAGVCIVPPGDAGSSGDGGSADADAPDQARSGCAGRGVQVGGAWACAGTFPKGGANLLCASGFSPCKSPAGIDLTACNQLSGFFVVDVLGFSQFAECRNVDPPLFRCGGFQAGFDNRIRYGCGGLAKPYVLTACHRQCGGFDRAINCSTEVEYLCGSSMGLPDETNLQAAIGTLCCPG